LIITIWSNPSLYFNSYHVVRTYFSSIALRPRLYTVSCFLFIYTVFTLLSIFPVIDTNLQIYFCLSIFLLFTITSLSRYKFFHLYCLKGENTLSSVILGQDICLEKIKKFNRDALHFGYIFVKNISTTSNYIQQLQNMLTSHKIDIMFLKDQDKLVTDNINAFCDENGLRLKLLLLLSSVTGRRA